MDYSKELAEAYLGKRIVVSIRSVTEGQEDSYSGLWGIVDSVHEDGILLKVEGGVENEYWMMPPDFDGISPAGGRFYQMDEYGPIIENVDFEAYWCISSNPDLLHDDKTP